LEGGKWGTNLRWTHEEVEGGLRLKKDLKAVTKALGTAITGQGKGKKRKGSSRHEVTEVQRGWEVSRGGCSEK